MPLWLPQCNYATLWARRIKGVHCAPSPWIASPCPRCSLSAQRSVHLLALLLPSLVPVLDALRVHLGGKGGQEGN